MDRGIPITQTKIMVPRRRSDLVTRQRLLDSLYDLLDHKLIILSAPAGYGKTSILIDFAHNTEWPFCWYSLDNFDRDPQRFIAHFISSIALQFPKFGQRSLSILQNMSQGDLNIDSLVSVIVNDIYENITEHFVIVLDDYHVVDDSKEVAYFVSQFTQGTDENCHIIVASRILITLPDLPLMVARSQVGGLSFEELAFLPGEIQTFMLQNYHLTISEAEAKDMARQTEGWITGLLLSTQMIRLGMPDRGRAVKASGVGLYDYMADQILDRQPKVIQDFMLRTSLLEEFNAELCKEVIGETLSIQEDWIGLMDTVFQNNLFILPVGDDGIWLRYHHLFRDFLQNRMRHSYPEETVKILARLAEVYKKREDWERTYELYKNQGDIVEIVQLIESFGKELINQGRIITLRDWLSELPVSHLRTNPGLLSLQGTVLMMCGDLQLSLENLNNAVEMMRPNSHPGLAETLYRRSVTYRTLGNYQSSLEDSQEALRLSSGNVGQKQIYARALHCEGMTLYHLGRLKEALVNLNQAVDLYIQDKDDRNAAFLQMEIGVVQSSAGNYLAAEHALTKALEFWQESNNTTSLANVLNNLGELQRLMGDFESSIVSLEKAIEYSHKSGYLRLEAYALTTIADLYVDLEALDQAAYAYNKAHQIAEKIQDKFLLIYLHLGEAVLENRRGNSFQANKLIACARKLGQFSGSQYELNLCALESGRILVINKDFKASLPELEPAMVYFQKEGHQVHSIRAHLYYLIARFEIQSGPSVIAELRQLISLLAVPELRSALISTVREMRSFLEPLQKEDDLGVSLTYLLQEVDRFEQSLSGLRRQLRRKATIVPFAVPKMVIQALGKTMVKVNDHQITNADWQTQSACDLFFFMLAHQEGITKEAVGDILWLDSSPAELKMRFKNTIYRLRHAVGKEAVVYQDDIYRFNSAMDYEYDVENFYKEIYHAERATDRQQKINYYQAALKFYQGEYLPEGDDTWIVVERQKIYNIYINALIKIANLYLENGDFENTIHCCQRILSEDPCMEDGHRLAMRAYAAMGNRAALVRQYEYCRQVLSEELNTTPSTHTQSLYETLTR